MILPERHVLSRGCLVGSAVTLGHGLQIANGFYDDRALAWLTLAFALALAGTVALRRSSRPLARHEDWLRLVTCVAIGWQIVSLLADPPGMYLQERANVRWFKAGVMAEAGIIAVGALGVRSLARAWFPLLLAAHVALGTWMLHASPSPHIDVVVVHREAFDALGHGRSPYQGSFQNIYGPESGFYNPQLVAGDRVLFGYPYPPLSLLLAAPGHLIAGDYRYAELVAWIGAAALVGYGRPALFSKLAAALLLTQPRGFFVLEQGWTEPIALLVLASTLFAMNRKPALTAWAGGLLIVTKQYLVLALPLLWRFARGRPSSGFVLARMGTIAALVTLPFVLWHPRSFIDSVLLLQTREPFRIDSLSYLSWAARHELGMGSFLWAVGAAAVALGAGMLTIPNTPAGFAATLAVSAFTMFAFGSKAFCNYYFFVAGALCCASSAACGPGSSDHAGGSPPLDGADRA